MKRALILLLLAAAVHMNIIAQVGISANGAAPDPSAMLDLDVASLIFKKGLLVPRMTAAERIAMPAPAQGAMVYETGTDLFWHYNGTAWVPLFGTAVGWRIITNAGITAGTHFLGTLDAVPLEFRRFNQRSGFLSAGSANTAWGYRALVAPTATSNVAYGTEALRFNTSGAQNTAVGAEALRANLTGSSNVAVGYQALRQTTATSGQTAVGAGALRLANAAPGSTAIGIRTMSAWNGTVTNCTAAGYETMFWNQGANNTGCGYQALYNNMVGEENTAIGRGALDGGAGSGMTRCTALFAMEFCASETDATAIGSSYMSGGNSNTAMGRGTLASLTNGTLNTAIGESSLDNSTSGDQNTCLGYNTNNTLSPAVLNQCTAIGFEAGVANTMTAANNAAAVGYDSYTGATNAIRIGNLTNNNGLTGGYGAWQNLSDARFKREVRADVPGLAFIMGLRPVTYRYDVRAYDVFTGQAERMRKRGNAEEIAAKDQAVQVAEAMRHTGFIAQEVDSLAQALGFEFSGVHRPTEPTDHFTIGYEQFVVPLVKAVQEQQVQLEAVRAEQLVLLHAVERMRPPVVPSPEPK